MNDVSAFTLGEAHFKECQLVHEFLNNRVRPRLARVASGPVNDTSHGALLRVLAWMRSLWKLNEPADFQAASVASRSLFEIAVDVTILHFDPANPPAKLIAWEDSAKLKAAIELRDYFQRQGELLPPEDPHIRFIATDEARVQNLRVQYWNARHPRNRWTGRNLREDARSATQLFPEGKFEHFYETRHAPVCWNTHGSGIAGVRSIQKEHFPGLTALAFRDSVQFSLIAAEIILRLFGLWDAETAVEFDGHKSDRTFHKYATISGLSVDVLRQLATTVDPFLAPLAGGGEDGYGK